MTFFSHHILIYIRSDKNLAQAEQSSFQHNYNLYRIDRAGRGGGVAVHVKSGLSALKMNLSCNIAIIVVGVHRPPSAFSSATHNLADLLAQ